MSIITGDLRNVVAQIFANAKIANIQLIKEMDIDTDFYKVQVESFGGNGIYFNSAVENRFSLRGKTKGVMYLATTPHTGLKEYYQDEPFVTAADLSTNCMAVLQATRKIKVIDLSVLAPLLKIPLGDLMGPKTVYGETQLLAEELSGYADGMEYLSRHTGKPCLALWSDAVDGNGMLKNLSVIPLSQYNHNGETAQQILKSQLDIHIL
ncbi:RES family NAD+ phosphorylase (plasmid) [Cedecea neteri]|uniref:RES family NAD+ phosphorylase n=1 Tax=Cedecea neteri TaxID=158822 RepID=UPI00289372C4|nr:RES family NAD+ phosphorylase [Cedecea neteri]WNJ82223.1 RES family NAD+ phosphorylase [Cedecea neteri]